jgi:hypothetical protein
VAQRGISSASEERGLGVGELRRDWAYEVDASVELDEAPVPDSQRDLSLGYPGLQQLFAADDSVLSSRQGGDHEVRRTFGDLCADIEHNPANVFDAPL